MSTEKTTPRPEPRVEEVPQTWGTPLPPGAREVDVPIQVEVRPHWSARKVLGAVALAVVVVGGGTVAAIAATQPSTPTNTHPSAGVSGGQVTGGSHHGYPGGYPGPFSNAVHGDVVVRTSTGAFATERFQTGTVTKLATNSISLTSPDHYAGTYLINSSTVINRGAITIHDIKVGDTVTVVAILSGNVATATTVTDGADKQYPSTHTGNGTGGMQPNDTTSPNPGN